MPASPDPLGWIGAVLETKYRIDAFVGEGGFGCVYRGTHLRLGKPIAIKFLRPELASGHEKQRKFLVRFLAEGQILHDLSRATAGVVQAMDLGAAVSPRGAWTPFIVMEWIDGRTLADELRQRPTRSVAEAIALLEPLLAALEIAHELGVAHLDLKPPNVMLARIGARETMKALDFGIAKAMGSAEEAVAPGKSGIGTRVFTPSYGAPEQFDPSLGSTGPWTDVYALGLMLIEVVDGGRPYGSDDALVCRRKALDLEERPSLSDDRSLDAVMRRVLAVDPRNRPNSAAELRRALAQSTLDKAPSRTGLRVAVGGLAFLAIGGGGVAYWHAQSTSGVVADAGSPVGSSSIAVDATGPSPGEMLFAKWEQAESAHDAGALAPLLDDRLCYYGNSFSRGDVVSVLGRAYEAGLDQTIDGGSVRFFARDASARTRVEFWKTWWGAPGKGSGGGFLVFENGKVVAEGNLGQGAILDAGCRSGDAW